MKRYIISFTLLLCCCAAGAQTLQEWRDSVSVLSQMIERSPLDLTLRLKKAACNIEMGQWQYALDEYTYVLDREPKNMTALYYRGYVNQHMGRLSFARKDYEDLLMVDPLNSHALMGLVMVNMEDKRTTQAFYDANRLVEQLPESAEAYAVRAEVERELDMTEAAIEDIEKAISIEDAVVKKKYPNTVDDDITSYQLTAFALYVQKRQKDKAKAALDYLVENGVPRTALVDYYTILNFK